MLERNGRLRMNCQIHPCPVSLPKSRQPHACGDMVWFYRGYAHACKEILAGIENTQAEVFYRDLYRELIFAQQRAEEFEKEYMEKYESLYKDMMI